jgi:HD-like signal output (HDOD) protein
MVPELERRILSCPTLPSLPAVALELLRLCRGEDIDLRDVAEAISRDPALSARVLRAANSASLAARGKVSTLTRAVPLLGSNATLTLALSFSLVRGRRRDDRSGFDHHGFWRRAVFSALAGRVLAESGVRSADPEEAFLAALLQDLGMLALAEVFPREYGPMCKSAGTDHATLVEAERREWGCDHAAVSGLLARTWSLPAFFGEAMAASHERPGDEDSDRRSRLGACVRASGWIADIWTTAEWQAIAAARAALGADGAMLERLIERMALAVPEAAADFDIDLGGPERLETAPAIPARPPPGRASGPPPPSTPPPIWSSSTRAPTALRSRWSPSAASSETDRRRSGRWCSWPARFGRRMSSASTEPTCSACSPTPRSPGRTRWPRAS